MLAAVAGRSHDDVDTQLARRPNVERDADAAVIGFSGLTLRTTAHSQPRQRRLTGARARA